MDHYKVLGINKNASKSDIKEAFRKLALKFHPDKQQQQHSDNATLKFKQASEAYQVLIDDRKRAVYNQTLRSGFNNHSYNSYSYRPASRYSHPSTRWRIDPDVALRFMTSRAFLLNLAFAGVLLAGAVFIDTSGEALWKMQNSGKSFEEAVESLEKNKREKDA